MIAFLPRCADCPRVRRWRNAALPVILVLATWWPAKTLAQIATQPNAPVSSQPASTRYTAPPGTRQAHPNQQQYQRYQQSNQNVQRDTADMQRRTSGDSIDRDIQRRRIQLDADRQATEVQRTLTRDPVESEQLRQDFEQKQQSFDRWRRDLERSRSVPPTDDGH